MRKNRYAYKSEGITKEILEEEYKNLKSLNKIGKKYQVHCDTVISWFKKFNIQYDNLKRTKNETIFDEDNETSFYLAGFIAADGSLSKNGKRGLQLSIALSTEDREHLIKLYNLLGCNGKITTKKNHTSSIDGRKIYSNSMDRFQVCSMYLCNKLQERFNITFNKSLTYEFPEILKNHSLVHHFIRGYFDGDGTFALRNPNIINKQSKINITFGLPGTQNFVENVQKILTDNIDNLNKNKIYKINNLYNIMYCGNRQVSLIGDWLYKDATIYLGRKYQRYLLAKSILNENN